MLKVKHVFTTHFSYLFFVVFALAFFASAYTAFAVNYVTPGATLDPGVDFPLLCADPLNDCTTEVLRIGNSVGNATNGSVLFIDSTGELAEDNAALFWDETNDRLGIGDTTPQAALTVGAGDAFQINASGAITAATGLTSSGSVVFSGIASGVLTSSGGTISSVSAVPVAQGGTGTSTAFTSGALVFAGTAGVYTQDPTALFWDETNNRLGIGTDTPQFALDLAEETVASSAIEDNSSVTGLEDMTVGGTYTGTTSDFYCIELADDVTVPNTFNFYDASCGNLASANVSITAGVAQTLANGVTITFATDSGHTAFDVWVINLTPATYVGDINFGGSLYNGGTLWSGAIGGVVDGATAGVVPFVDSNGLLGEDTSFTFDESTTRLTANSFNMPSTTTGGNGVLYRNGTRFLHNYGTNNTFLGLSSGNLSLTTGSAIGNTAVGASSLDALTTGNENVAVGQNALGSNQDGSDNVAVGMNSLVFNVSGTSNVAVGRLALQRNLGSNNTGLGTGSFQQKGSGDNNVGIGFQALYGGSTNYNANYNVGIGSSALLFLDTGADYNIGIGESAGGGGVLTGDLNIFIGRGAGDSTTSGERNIIFGTDTAPALNTGANNILIGDSVATILQSGSRNILIGDGIDTPALGTNDYLSIADIIFGDLSVGNIGIGDSTPLSLLTVGSGDLFQVDTNGDMILNQLTPNITIDNSAVLNILNEDGDNLFSLTDYNNVFGSVAESGAFVSRQSYFGEEFSRDRASSAADANQAWGDFQAWGLDETTNCVWEVVDDTINGIGRVRTNAAAAGNACIAYKSAAAGNAHLEYNISNLPVIYMKAKAFGTVSATDNFWIGLGDAAAGSTTAPTNGIFFENNGGTTWVGTTRSGGTSTNVACGTTVSTTNFALLKIEVLSSTSVRFSMDDNVSDGVSFTTCGTSATNIPATTLTTMIKSASNATNTGVDVDFFRAWQDDNENSILDIVIDEVPSADEYEVWLEEKSEEYTPEGGALEELSQKLADGFAWVEEYIFNRITALVGVFDRIESRRVETEELCVGSTCITEEQFIEVFVPADSAEEVVDEPQDDDVDLPVDEGDDATGEDPIDTPVDDVPGGDPEGESTPLVSPEPEPVLEDTPLPAVDPAVS